MLLHVWWMMVIGCVYCTAPMLLWSHFFFFFTFIRWRQSRGRQESEAGVGCDVQQRSPAEAEVTYLVTYMETSLLF